ncbi:wntless [Carabus blaptoides fortunei]
MSGTILENLSGKKLCILVSILLVSQAICFLVGGLIAPPPASTQPILGTACVDDSGDVNNTKKFFTRQCYTIDFHKINDDPVLLANKIVFVFQMPHPQFDYSRWQQNLVGVLSIDMKYKPSIKLDSRIHLTLDSRLAYRNKGDPPNEWKYYASSLEQRTVECDFDYKGDGYPYNCSSIPLFELGSLHHDYYLLNLRLPVDTEKQMNQHIGHIADIWLAAINQNGGFTKVWISLKTVFFPFIIGIMIWFWRRVHMLSRSPALLEYMLIYLAAALTFLNAPLEYLTLAFDMPYMLLLSDIRQGIFYAMLLSFWLIFAGEHMLIQDNGERNTLKIYWRHLSAVVVGCISLFVFDLCERGVQLRNPFYSIWVTDLGTNLALTFIILAGISAGIYFVFLCYMVWKVFCNISVKRTALPSMSVARRLHYEGIIYRFKFLMLSTLVCAAMTVVWFILGQIAEGQWKWDDHMEWELTSAFYTGVYGMWNIYIFALLILYAPSHKQWPSESGNDNSISEQIEFSRLPTDPSPSEISSLTSFTRKTTLD